MRLQYEFDESGSYFDFWFECRYVIAYWTFQVFVFQMSSKKVRNDKLEGMQEKFLNSCTFCLQPFTYIPEQDKNAICGFLKECNNILIFVHMCNFCYAPS